MLTIDLMRDNNSADCDRIVKQAHDWIINPNPSLICVLPDTFDEYWLHTISGKARCEYRKAVKNGILLEQITNTGKIDKELYEIQHSTEIRQGRPLTPKYYGKKWDAMDLARFKCPRHYEEFWIAKRDDKPVSYVWLVVCGEYIKTKSIMGHIDYWKYGIMKFMLIEILKTKIGKNRYFSYGTKSFLNHNLKYFCRDLGLTCPERQVINE